MEQLVDGIQSNSASLGLHCYTILRELVDAAVCCAGRGANLCAVGPISSNAQAGISYSALSLLRVAMQMLSAGTLLLIWRKHSNHLAPASIDNDIFFVTFSSLK